MGKIAVRIDEFTDPICPWAWSAEPFRRRLEWLYGDSVEFVPRMVILADDRSDQEEKGFTPEKLSGALQKIASEHKMPIDTRVRDAVPASLPACRAVVAARVHADPATTRHLLRELRLAHFRAELVDNEDVLREAWSTAGLDPSKLDEWTDDEGVAEELEADRAAARKPNPAARVLDDKLANWSGGRRYTCPTYEITRLDDEVTIAAPGFQPFAVYDTILANLVPGTDRREPPESPHELLEWADCALSTREVAVLCEVDFDRAREELGRIASLEPIGSDGLWTLN